MKHFACYLMLTAAPAFAQSEAVSFPDVTANPDVLYGCLASGNDAATCTGAMTVDCRAENALGNENLEERLCVIEELNIWRALMLQERAVLQDRLGELPEDQHPTVTGDPAPIAAKAGALWDQWQQNQCRMELAAMGNHPRRAIIEDTCSRDLTALQFGRLRAVNGRLGIK